MTGGKTTRRIWFEMDSQGAVEDWMPNAVKLDLSESAIAVIEKAISQTGLAAVLPGGGATAERKLPEGSVEFFNVWDWVDRSIRTPGSLSRGATRVKREPWQGEIQNPCVRVSPQGVTIRAWCPAHRQMLVSVCIGIEEFRARVRDMRARELASSIDEAMPGEEGEAQPPRMKGPAPL